MRLTAKPRTLRFALVAFFAAGGLLVWGELAPVDGLIGQFGWKDRGDAAESDHPMQFWVKRLD